MKSAIVVLLLACLLTAPVFGQEILRIVKGYALIDIDESSGLRVGDEIPVYRESYSGTLRQVGTLKIVRYGGGKCAAKIVARVGKENVMVGDLIRLGIAAETLSASTSASGEPGSIGIEKGDKEVGFMGFWTKTIGNEFMSAQTGIIRLNFGYYWTDRLQVGAAPQWIIVGSEGINWYFFSISFYVNYNFTTSSKMVPYITGEWYQEEFSFYDLDILEDAFLTFGLGLRNFLNEYAALNTSIKYGFSLGGVTKRTVLTIMSGVSVIF